MKNRNFYFGLLLMLPLQSCIDKNYDLSNVDTNIMVPIENLTVPVSIGEIALHTILDVDDNSQIKEKNGEYAVVVEGEFETENIKVDKFGMNGANIKDIIGKSKKSAPAPLQTIRRAPGADGVKKLLASYTLPQNKTSVSVNAKDITDAIKSLKSLKIDSKITTEINLDKNDALSGVLDSITVNDFSFKLPKGFEGKLKAITEDGKEIAADYIDVHTGIATFKSNTISSKTGKLCLEFDVTGINESVLNDVLEQIQKNKNFKLEDDYGVDYGLINVCEEDFAEKHKNKDTKEKYNVLPDELNYLSEQKMDEVSVKEFSGDLEYNVKDFDIDPIGLENIPDMLNQTGTCLNFANPQIYLGIKNPIKDGEDNTIPAITGFEIESLDKDGKGLIYQLDKGEKICADKEETKFYMSPNKLADKDKYEDYESATHVKFSNLGQILSGGNLEESLGIPVKMIVKAIDTKVEAYDVKSFALGKEYESIKGHYVFYAPLSLTSGSRIRYTDTIDGWNDSDIDNISINRMNVSCTVSTEVPFALVLKVTPIDKYGKRINANATAKVKANAKNQAIAFEIKGNIKHLDGIIIDATAIAESSETLRPDMKIKLGKIQTTISGSYQTEL